MSCYDRIAAVTRPLHGPDEVDIAQNSVSGTHLSQLSVPAVSVLRCVLVIAIPIIHDAH